MLKVRIIGVLVVKGDMVVQSIGFNKYFPVGSPAIAIDYLNRWGIDEIVLLDINAMREGRRPRFDAIRKYSKYCHVPLSVGGGIKDIDDIRELIHSGADKIILNTAAINNPSLIAKGSGLFGNQCIVVSIDARPISPGKYEVFIDSGRSATGYAPADLAQKAEKHGAGEILLNSIDRDGSKKGYDLTLISQVMGAVNIPVIACGGVSHPRHFQEAIKDNVPAVAAANFFHYTEHSVITVKSYLKAHNADVRLDSYASYNGFNFDHFGRAGKIEDSILDKLRFEYIPEEVI